MPSEIGRHFLFGVLNKIVIPNPMVIGLIGDILPIGWHLADENFYLLGW